MLIEQVSGESYPEFLQERLLKPLGLKHTRYDSDTATFPDLATGYVGAAASAPSWSVCSKFSAGGL
jgi:serine beta-lactamase-like protein LACTB